MDKIRDKFAQLIVKKSDINEHLATLARYASECNSIVEFGVRTWLSTYALLAGKPENATMVSFDIETNKDVDDIIKICKDGKIKWNFVLWDSRYVDIDKVDLIFIDTLHNYDLLKLELEKHWQKAQKYIIFHDTTTFWEKWETVGHEWLNKAIKEYQVKYPEWTIKEIYTNNNWLTILERKWIPEITVFTAIYWGIDTLKKQPQQDIPVRWVCFTDDENIKCEDWAREQRDIRVVAPHKHLHPRMQAKYFRTHPYDYLDSKIVFYMDGSARLKKTNSISHFVGQYLDKSDILTFQHPERNCIYDEAVFCKTREKYLWLPMEDQVTRYWMKWYPKNYWLTWTWVLITKKSNTKIIDFLHKRWTECLEWTYQDQLSFDYLVWKEWIKRQRFTDHEWNNDYIDFRNPHLHTC